MLEYKSNGSMDVTELLVVDPFVQLTIPKLVMLEHVMLLIFEKSSFFAVLIWQKEMSFCNRLIKFPFSLQQSFRVYVWKRNWSFRFDTKATYSLVAASSLYQILIDCSVVRILRGITISLFISAVLNEKSIVAEGEKRTINVKI